MKTKLLVLASFVALSVSVFAGYNYYKQQDDKLLAEQCCSGDAMATCYGKNPCNACKNCKYCKHCSKDGKTCGVCKKN